MSGDRISSLERRSRQTSGSKDGVDDGKYWDKDAGNPCDGKWDHRLPMGGSRRWLRA